MMRKLTEKNSHHQMIIIILFSFGCFLKVHKESLSEFSGQLAGGTPCIAYEEVPFTQSWLSGLECAARCATSGSACTCIASDERKRQGIVTLSRPLRSVSNIHGAMHQCRYFSQKSKERGERVKVSGLVSTYVLILRARVPVHAMSDCNQ